MNMKPTNSDFDRWNEKKKKLAVISKKHLFKEGDVWWISLGLNIDSESYGKGEEFRRPVLVLRKLSGSNFIGIPLSSRLKQGTWFAEVKILGEDQTALLYQVRMFSSNRLQRRLTTLEDNDFNQIKEKLKDLLELSK
ncbi:MAG: hypothetical protein Crog4KO_18920 [Crocinitomicaceae bacterium]